MALRKLIISMAICLGAGGIGAIFTLQSVDTWYAMLKKPVFTPPDWIFAPVWLVLYILMAISVYILWYKRQTPGQYAAAYVLFGTQLVLNIGWSYVFFGMHSIIGGLFLTILLWLALSATIYEFLHYSQIAGWLLIPYLVWVSYAGLLNFGLWWMNR